MSSWRVSLALALTFSLVPVTVDGASPPKLAKPLTPHTVPTTVPPLVSPEAMAQWSRVAQCEEGGNWYVRGSVYSGGLGIRNDNWRLWAGRLGLPMNAADASPEQQVWVAQHINGTYVPDQEGRCRKW